MDLKWLKRFAWVPGVAAGILAIGFGLPSCDKKLESIEFGAIPSGSAALIYIAQDQGFLEENGVRVTVKDYPTGVKTTDALLRGEVDIAWAAEFPVVHRAFAGEKISILAALSRFRDQYLFARKDRGIADIPALKAKKIGIPRNTIVEFYLARFLELNGMSIRDLSLINIPPPQSTEAISSGKVDGVVTWEPYSRQIKEQMAGKVTAWPVQNSQPGYGVILARNDWIDQNPRLIIRFLKSLAQAEDYLVRHPRAAKDIVKKRVGYDDASIEIFWSENQFSLFLDQSLVLAMEDEARWMVRDHLVPAKQIPDFLNYVHENGLKTLKPGAVDIIR